MRTLLDTYVQLARKQSLSYTDAYNLVSIEATLADQYGITKEALDKLVQSTDNYTESLNGVVNAGDRPGCSGSAGAAGGGQSCDCPGRR